MTRDKAGGADTRSMVESLSFIIIKDLALRNDGVLSREMR